MARNNALYAFRKEIAPSYSTFDIELMDSTEAISSEPAKHKLTQGIEFAKARRLDRACELWQELDGLTARSASIPYNLAVCAEASGDIEKAGELYKKADRMLERPDDRVSIALQRIEKAKRDMAKFRKQLN